MKRMGLFTLLCVIATYAIALKKDPSYLEARRSGASAKMQIHVVDDCGCCVQDADVKIFMGMNFRPKGYWINGTTDTNGLCIVEGKTCGDEICIDAAKQGYYPSTKKLCFVEIGSEREVMNNRWLPYGSEEKIVLKRIIAPCNLIVFDKLVDVPQTNTWLGFDMEVQSFVKPFGTGVDVDFELRVDWDGLPAWESKRCTASIRFSADKTGGYYVAHTMESKFPYPYNAITNSLFEQKLIRIVERNGDPHSTKVPFQKNTSFVIRTRSILDTQGKIEAANYGRIEHFEIGPSRRGVALLRMSYVFNPTPNDTNLEPN